MQTPPPCPGPLSGITVLDLTRLLPGPMCTRHLADLGADVLKIEEPGGDPARRLAPAAFRALNRGKRSLVLDLSAEEGRDLFLALARTADVVVEGFRPGVADRLGVGAAAVAAANPAAVHCSITGYGATGPWAGRAGHDINYLAVTGVLDATGTEGGPPAVPGFQLADIAGGALTAAMTICAALVEARATGRGRRIDVAMADSVLAHQPVALDALETDGAAPARGGGRLTGGLPCYGVYPTADGRWLALGALEPKFWAAFCDRLGRPDLIPHGHAAGVQGARVRAEVAAVLGARPLAHWTAHFEGTDCCLTPVLTFAEALAHEQAAARGIVAAEADGLHFAFPALLDGERPGAGGPAPAPGEHADAVLAGLGLDADAVAGLRARGVV
ncbi:MAG TPA: CaiB/BaiF CoA-transferase family protein [Azospirillaceae bacterium]|nr:CaiB/BaiF CoA-transferase family protein [Azospirillaceae bacterium]